MRNHYIRLAEIVQEGVREDLPDLFRASEQRIDLNEALGRITELRSIHQQRASELWSRDHHVSEELRRSSALADLCAFFVACLRGDPSEYRDTALDAVQILGYPGEQEMIRILSR